MGVHMRERLLSYHTIPSHPTRIGSKSYDEASDLSFLSPLPNTYSNMIRTGEYS